MINAEDAGRLLENARSAASGAYSPYSCFQVGAAVLTADGDIFTGANVENASYGLTICAERVAIFRAVVESAAPMVAIAISCPALGEDERTSLRMPCGACRQVMSEFAGLGGEEDLIVLVDGLGTFSLRSLLPRPFVIDR